MPEYQFTFLDKFKKDYKLSKKKNVHLDNDFSQFLENFNADEGVLVSATNGAKKVRFSKANSGKSGSYRVYYYFELEDKVYLLRLFAKNQQSELSMKEKIAISEIVKAIKGKQ